MIVLVIGGSGSGKSRYAESFCDRLGSGRKIYLATMEPGDAESLQRIDRHRQMRRGHGYETVECYTHLEDVTVPPNCTVLLECLSNLAANEMFSPDGRREQSASCILRGLRGLAQKAQHLVIVSNQVFSDGIAYDGETDAWLRLLAKLNEKVAIEADEVYEIVHGIPILLKGGLK